MNAPQYQKEMEKVINSDELPKSDKITVKVKKYKMTLKEMEKEIPKYYIGKKHKYEARKVVEDFQPDNYNLGTAITYLLRAGKKAGNPMVQDIRKAINHLQFELDKINGVI